MEKEKVLKIFGQNLRYYREKANTTIKELSEKSKIRKEYIEKIETGKAFGMSLSHVLRLSNALKIKPHILCEGI